jgi:hypothetical protein
MTNNTIPNVPRELLATALKADASIGASAIDLVAGWKAMAQLRALLSAPSPASVDGLEVVAYLAKTVANGRTTTRAALGPVSIAGLRYSAEDQSATIESDEPLCRLSDAKAIIDGLRGEVGAQRVKTCIALKERNYAREERDSFQRVGIRAMEEHDRLAQRIGELEGLLRDCENAFADIGADEWCERIDAALSSGKEGA